MNGMFWLIHSVPIAEPRSSRHPIPQYMRFGYFIDIPFHWRISLPISTTKMNKKQLIFTPVLRHMSRNSEGRLLGRDSGARSQEATAGWAGQSSLWQGHSPMALEQKREQPGPANMSMTARWGCNNRADLRSSQKDGSAS